MTLISALYVDDEPDLLELTRMYLEADSGISLDTCTSAIEAQTLLAARRYDVIISDYQMPEMDGIAFLKYVRQHSGRIPFILFTGRGREQVVIQAFENGADSYIQKGGDPKAQFAELRNRIEKSVAEFRAVTSQKDAERRIADIISFLPDATFAIDRDGTVLSWNRAIEEMTGISADRMIGRGNYEYAIPFYGERRPILIDLIFSTPDEIRKHYSGIVRSGAMLAAETDLPRLQGSPRVLWGKASPLFDQNGAVVGAIEVIRDITDQKATERALRESEEKFREMADMLPQVVYETDTNGILTYANALAFDQFGYSPEEFRKGLRATDMIVPAERESAARVFREILARKPMEPGGREYHVMHRDGRIFPVTFYSTPIIHGGNITGLRGIVVDISGRKAVEEQLKERERVLTTLISNLPGFVYRCRNDRDWTMTYISEGCRDLTGYTPDDFLENRTVAYNDIIHPDHRERIWKAWQETLVQKGIFEDEYPLNMKEGETRWVWERGQGIFSDDGRVLFLEGFVTDVTRRKKTEDALAAKTAELERKSRYYELLLQISTDAIHVVDKEGRLREWNQAFLSHLGYSDEEAAQLNVSDWDALTPTAEQRVRISDLIREGGMFETLHRRKDGSVREVEIKASTIVINGEELLYASARDITNRKLAEESLRKNQEQLALAIEGSGAGLWDWDIPSGRVAFNERWAEISGYTLADLEPVSIKTWQLLCHPEDLQQSGVLLQKHLSGKTPFYELEARMRHKDGSWVWVLDRGKVVAWDAAHRPVRMIGTHMDITRLKHMEDALRQANTKLNLLNSITRHDIMNQLMALKGFLALSHGIISDPVRMGELIAKEERIADTLERQMTFTRYYQDMGIKEPAWQNVDTCVRREASSLSLHGVELRIDFSDLEIFADPLLEKVFYNLLDNALRYGGETLRTIHVSFVETGDGLILSCEDDGAGISAEDKKHLFERGFGKNTGLGLFLAREILGITGLTIRETGVFGKGARFEMLVPRGMYRFSGA